MNNIVFGEDINDISEKLASDLIASYTSTIKNKDFFTLAISGGNSPKVLFNILAKNQTIDWSKIKLFWVDERCVKPDTEESNYFMTYENLIKHINIPQENIFRIKGEEEAKKEVKDYINQINNNVISENNYPKFDYIVLGMGNDGHTASIFPSNRDDIQSDEVALVAVKPENAQLRITLSLKTINNSENVSFLISGLDKAEVLKEVIENKNSIYPSSFIENKNLKFFVDKFASKFLKSKTQ